MQFNYNHFIVPFMVNHASIVLLADGGGLTWISLKIKWLYVCICIYCWVCCLLHSWSLIMFCHVICSFSEIACLTFLLPCPIFSLLPFWVCSIFNTFIASMHSININWCTDIFYFTIYDVHPLNGEIAIYPICKYIAK